MPRDFHIIGIGDELEHTRDFTQAVIAVVKHAWVHSVAGYFPVRCFSAGFTRRGITSCWSQPRLARVVYRFGLWFIHIFLSGAAQRPR